MKAIILARVSTKRQEDEGLSLDYQLETLRNYAKESNFEVAKEFVFHESAGHKIRRNFDELMDYIKQNADVKGILAFRVDRMTRNFRDAVALDTLRTEHDKELHFVHDRLVLTGDSVGRDIQDWDLKVFLAKQYLNRLKEDGVNTWRHKLRNGEWSGKATCGYKNVELEGKKKWIEIDEDRAPLVRKAFELYATGDYSYEILAKKLAKIGLTTNTDHPKPMYKNYLDSQIINNPFYYGEMLYKGKLYKHQYEPLIPKYLYDKCQQVKESWNKKPFKYGAKEFAFKGLISCSSCDTVLSTYTQKGHNYVRCHSCKKVHIKEDVLLSQIGPLFKKLEIPSAVLEDLKSRLKSNHEGEGLFYEHNVKRINSEISKNKNRMKVMYEDRLDGRITYDEYDKMIVDLKKKEQDLLSELGQHSKADEQFLISSSYLLELANRAHELFMNSQPAQKNKLLKLILANLEIKDGKLIPKLKNLFQGVLICNERQEWLPRLDSNQ
jgi:site-specific DNA recombinase